MRSVGLDLGVRHIAFCEVKDGKVVDVGRSEASRSSPPGLVRGARVFSSGKSSGLPPPMTCILDAARCASASRQLPNVRRCSRAARGSVRGEAATQRSGSGTIWPTRSADEQA
jgi:hypothetical protein